MLVAHKKIAKVEMDLEQDIFFIYLKKGAKLSFEKIKKMVKKLGYKAVKSKISHHLKNKKMEINKNIPLSLKSYFKKAETTKKLVFIKGSAVWCLACRKLEQAIDKSKDLQNYLNQNFIVAKIDIGKNKEVKEWLKIYAVPATFVLSPKGTILGHMIGFKNTKEYFQKLRSIVDKQRKEKKKTTPNNLKKVGSKEKKSSAKKQ